MEKNIIIVFNKIIVVFFLVSCGAPAKKVSDDNPLTRPENKLSQRQIKEQRDLFNQGVLELDSGQLKKSAQSFEEYLRKYPSSRLEFMTLYNLGVAYEGVGHCGTAANRYRKIIKNSKGKNLKLEARAMLRLSYMYECLKKDTLVVATLNDLFKKSENLPIEVGKAELPARLAAAYSRLGNRLESQRYFQMAQEGLKVLNKTTFGDKQKKEIMAKTFFSMGDMSHVNLKNIEDVRFVDHVRALQVYLLRSIELDEKIWSLRSANQLVDAYDSVIDEIEKNYSQLRSVRAYAKKNRKIKKIENISIKTIQALEELITQRFPDKNEPRIVVKFFDEIEKRRDKIQLSLASHTISKPLTESAIERKKRLQPKKTQDIEYNKNNGNNNE